MKHDDIAACYIILTAIENPRAGNVPSHILHLTRLQSSRFKHLIANLEVNGAIQIARGVRRTGSKNKFFITDKGRKFISNYEAVLDTLGFKTQNLFPEIFWKERSPF